MERPLPSLLPQKTERHRWVAVTPAASRRGQDNELALELWGGHALGHGLLELLKNAELGSLWIPSLEIKPPSPPKFLTTETWYLIMILSYPNFEKFLLILPQT